MGAFAPNVSYCIKSGQKLAKSKYLVKESEDYGKNKCKKDGES